MNKLMGFESLCYAMCDNKELVYEISRRLTNIYEEYAEILVQFERVKTVMVWDNMGFRSGTSLNPQDIREIVLVGHKRIGDIVHRMDKAFALHSCGNLRQIMDDLIDYVQIDAKSCLMRVEDSYKTS